MRIEFNSPGHHRNGQGHGHREPVHLGIVLVVGVVDIQVLVRRGVQVVGVRITVPDRQFDLLTIHPDPDEILIDSGLVLGEFLGCEDELHRHRIAGGDEIHVHERRVIGIGARCRVEHRVVVRPRCIGRCVGILVGLVRLAPPPPPGRGRVRDIARIPRRQDHTAVGRGHTGRDAVAIAVNARRSVRPRVRGVHHRHPIPEDRVRHLHGAGRCIDRKLRGCHHIVCPNTLACGTAQKRSTTGIAAVM